MTHLLVSPLKVQQTKVKNFILNLNVYRNTHYQTLNKVKVNYKNHLHSQILALPVMKKALVIFTLYPKTRRLCDVSNICSIHDKFIMDAIVSAGKMPDDNYTHIPRVTYRIGEVDKNNPRVEILIKEIE